MDNNNDKRRQLIDRATAMAPDAGAADGALHPWRRLSMQLTPLIGDAGFQALLSRSLRIAAAGHGWLPAAAQVYASQFEQLQTAFAAQTPPAVRAANLALLDTFTKLLSGLIGGALTLRLLNSAWTDQSEQNTQQEQK
ncbi:MAG TPA: hypothetical protein VIT92_16870 [Burkholderiaceae bacterium]